MSIPSMYEYFLKTVLRKEYAEHILLKYFLFWIAKKKCCFREIRRVRTRCNCIHVDCIFLWFTTWRQTVTAVGQLLSRWYTKNIKFTVWLCFNSRATAMCCWKNVIKYKKTVPNWVFAMISKRKFNREKLQRIQRKMAANLLAGMVLKVETHMKEKKKNTHKSTRNTVMAITFVEKPSENSKSILNTRIPNAVFGILPTSRSFTQVPGIPNFFGLWGAKNRQLFGHILMK